MVPRETAGLRLTAGERVYSAVSRGGFGLLRLLARVAGTPSAELRCRTGTMPKAPEPLFWFHGASAGEMAAALRLTTILRQHGQRFTAAYTAANRAGVELVTRAAAPDTVAALGPWDHPRWVARALEQWKPKAIFLVETELWPGLIAEAYRRRVPIFCVSARIYPRDVARYRFVRGLTATMLRRLTVILAQNEIERARLIALGAPPDRCLAAGNLKYASADTSPIRKDLLRDELGVRTDDQVIVFGSVHSDEIGLLFAALSQRTIPNLRVIIAPRHRSAIAAIVRESQRRNWICHSGTREPLPPSWQVLVLGEMGALGAAYAIASLAVVGGGFCKHGGHNPFEPVMLGTPVIFGRHFEHFDDEARALTATMPQAQVTDASQLADRIGEWLGSKARRQQVTDLQRQALPDGAGIATRYVAALSPWLPGTWT